MFENNRRYGWIRVLSGLLLLVILVGGGYMLFRAGFSQGAISATEGDLTVPEFARSVRWHYPYGGHFFFPGGFLFGLLFLFLIFGLFRRAFFAPRWGMHRMHGMKWKDKAEEWHLQMHDRMEGSSVKSDEGTDESPEENQ